MPGLFGHFDFKLLDDPEFGEDAVREELIVPLLTALGYSASPPYRIIRSRKLEHPFVYFGTVLKKITIIPDYLLERDGVYAWVLDAKGPNENINTGKNVEQAYSYAMHRDIRAPLYGLCSGRKLVVFDVWRAEPVIDVAMTEVEKIWPMVLGILGCRSAWPAGRPASRQTWDWRSPRRASSRTRMARSSTTSSLTCQCAASARSKTVSIASPLSTCRKTALTCSRLTLGRKSMRRFSKRSRMTSANACAPPCRGNPTNVPLLKVKNPS
jgi:hypothetical protein